MSSSPNLAADAALVCAAIAKQIDARFLGLETGRGAKIDFGRVAEDVNRKLSVSDTKLTASYCQKLWRWAAYGEQPGLGIERSDASALGSDDDDDAFAAVSSLGNGQSDRPGSFNAAYEALRSSDPFFVASLLSHAQEGTNLTPPETALLLQRLMTEPFAAATGTSAPAQPGGTATASKLASSAFYTAADAKFEAAVAAIIGPPPPEKKTAYQLYCEHYWNEAVALANSQAKSLRPGCPSAATPQILLAKTWERLDGSPGGRGIRDEFRKQEITDELRAAEAARRYQHLALAATNLLNEVSSKSGQARLSRISDSVAAALTAGATTSSNASQAEHAGKPSSSKR